MALLSSRGISTPSLQAQGEQRRFFYFNNDRDIPLRKVRKGLAEPIYERLILKAIGVNRLCPEPPPASGAE